MKRKSGLVAAIIFLAAGLAAFLIIHNSGDPMARFASRLDREISSNRIAQTVKALASSPHRAGTEANRKVGDEIIDRLNALNLKVSTSEYEVLLYQPQEQRLIMTAPQAREFDLREKILAEDPYSKIAQSESSYFAYSPDADLEAEVIYANFGTREDYAFLKEHGISLAGKIALVRAQGICRSMKNLIAEEEGIAGLLLYPELRDQGMKKPPFPKGPNLNPWVTQRGSMLKYFFSPGDPEQTMPRVPALPISADTAQAIFMNLNGTPAPDDWKGFMQSPYNIGPGPAKLRMVIKGKVEKKKIRNIFGLLPGKIENELTVLISSHYDAWVYGACDPGSGTATVLETASALSALHDHGWRPRRTIQFAFWDAEEFGMLGSSEWTRQNQDQLRSRLVTHLYVDSVRGKNFTAYITPGLHSVLDDVLKYVQEPYQNRIFSEIHGTYDLPGFSDDTAPMTGLLGTPSARLGFGTYYSTYHSVYDDWKWMNEFGDPGFRYSAALAKILSLLAIDLSTQLVVPFKISEVASAAADRISDQQILNPALEKAVQSFEQSAKLLERNVEEKQNFLQPDTAEQINLHILGAMQSFFISSDSFANRNQLVGPSPNEGCAGTLLPALKAGDQTTMNNSILAFERAANELREAARAVDSNK